MSLSDLSTMRGGLVGAERRRVPASTHGPLCARSLRVAEGFVLRDKRCHCHSIMQCVYK